MRHVERLLVPIILVSVVATLTIRAWWLWHATARQPAVPRWRSGAFFSGLAAVSLAFMIFVGIAGYAQISGGLGYNFAPATLWARVDLWLCLVGLTCAALGRGPGRGIVLIGALVMLGIWLGLCLST